MITRRTLEGALKCALRDFRREEDTAIVELSVSKIALRHECEMQLSSPNATSSFTQLFSNTETGELAGSTYWHEFWPLLQSSCRRPDGLQGRVVVVWSSLKRLEFVKPKMCVVSSDCASHDLPLSLGPQCRF